MSPRWSFQRVSLLKSEAVAQGLPYLFPYRIIPQAVSVRHGLSIGATCAPYVIGLMYIMGKSTGLATSACFSGF